MVKEGLYWFLILFVSGILSLKFLNTYYILPTVFFVSSVFVLYFFRNPRREKNMVYADDKIYSACDGKVFDIENKDGRKIIKVFMNVLNCHIQRVPYRGEIIKTEHRDGKFFPAYRKEAETENEQNIILIKTDRGDIEVKQIAGILARRIECWVKEGDILLTGTPIGMIKLGSQVDVSLPENVVLKVSTGDKVLAGRTVIAEW